MYISTPFNRLSIKENIWKYLGNIFEGDENIYTQSTIATGSASQNIKIDDKYIFFGTGDVFDSQDYLIYTKDLLNFEFNTYSCEYNIIDGNIYGSKEAYDKSTDIWQYGVKILKFSPDFKIEDEKNIWLYDSTEISEFDKTQNPSINVSQVFKINEIYYVFAHINDYKYITDKYVYFLGFWILYSNDFENWNVKTIRKDKITSTSFMSHDYNQIKTVGVLNNTISLICKMKNDYQALCLKSINDIKMQTIPFFGSAGNITGDFGTTIFNKYIFENLRVAISNDGLNYREATAEEKDIYCPSSSYGKYSKRWRNYIIKYIAKEKALKVYDVDTLNFITETYNLPKISYLSFILEDYIYVSTRNNNKYYYYRAHIPTLLNI